MCFAHDFCIVYIKKKYMCFIYSPNVFSIQNQDFTIKVMLLDAMRSKGVFL